MDQRLRNEFNSHYYINNRHEFFSENGHEKLLIGLKKYVSTIRTDKIY